MNRTPLMLLHGFTNTGASWDPLTAALGERYRPIAPDIRGHGAAGTIQPVTLDVVLADLAGLAPGSFELLGYSQGGRLALHLAIALRRRITRLHLIGASPGIADPDERQARQDADEALAAEIEQGDIATFATRWAQMPVLAGLSPELAAAAHADRLKNSPVGLARALRALGTGALPSLWDELGELTMPVTLIVGERDAKFRQTAEAMAQRIAQSTIVVIPGAGHAVHLEAPEAVAAAMAGP